MPYYINSGVRNSEVQNTSFHPLLSEILPKKAPPSKKSNIITQSPKIEIFITTPNGKQVKFINRDVGGNVVSLMVRKTLAEQAGVFTFVVVSKSIVDRAFQDSEEGEIAQFKTKRITNITDLLKRKSFIKIKINGVVQMLGRIDDVTSSTQPKGESTYTVTGRDFGGVFLDYKQWWTSYQNSPFNNVTTKSASFTSAQNFNGLMPKLITNIYNNWFDLIYTKKGDKKPTLQSIEDLGWYIINERNEVLTVKDILVVKDRDDYSLDKSKISAFAVNGALYTNESYKYWNQMSNLGDLFALFKQFVSNPLNEMFVTSGGREITLGKKFKTVAQSQGSISEQFSAAADRALRTAYGERGLAVLPTTIPDGAEPDRVKLDEDKAYLVLRPAPYHTKFNKEVDERDYPGAWPRLIELEDLETLIVNDSMIKNKSLNNYNAQKIYSTYAVQTSIAHTPEFAEAATTPIWDKNALRLFGYNPMVINISFLSPNNLKVKNLISTTANALQATLAQWFRYNDEALGGEILIAGDENAREGIAVEYARDIFGRMNDDNEERLYYCNGVEQTWQIRGEFNTKLFVEHGMKKFNRQVEFENARKLSQKNQASFVKIDATSGIA